MKGFLYLLTGQVADERTDQVAGLFQLLLERRQRNLHLGQRGLLGGQVHVAGVVATSCCADDPESSEQTGECFQSCCFHIWRCAKPRATIKRLYKSMAAPREHSNDMAKGILKQPFVGSGLSPNASGAAGSLFGDF